MNKKQNMETIENIIPWSLILIYSDVLPAFLKWLGVFFVIVGVLNISINHWIGKINKDIEDKKREGGGK